MASFLSRRKIAKQGRSSATDLPEECFAAATNLKQNRKILFEEEESAGAEFCVRPALLSDAKRPAKPCSDDTPSGGCFLDGFRTCIYEFRKV